MKTDYHKLWIKLKNEINKDMQKSFQDESVDYIKGIRFGQKNVLLAMDMLESKVLK